MDQQVHISCLGLVRNVIGCGEEDIQVLHGTTVGNFCAFWSTSTAFLFNSKWGRKNPYKLAPKERCTMHELCDRRTKSPFGPERGIDCFTTRGYHKQWRSPDDNYPGPLIKARFAVYFENMLRIKESVRKWHRSSDIVSA